MQAHMNLKLFRAIHSADVHPQCYDLRYGPIVLTDEERVASAHFLTWLSHPRSGMTLLDSCFGELLGK